MALRPIVLKGYSPYLPAESGLAPNTIEGRLGNTKSITSFSYSKDIQRRFSVAPASFGTTIRGPWDIQVYASKETGAKLLFDQSVDLGALTLGAGDPVFGSFGIFDYFFFTDETENSSQGRFKTRVVSGEHVPVKLEGQTPAMADWPAIAAPLPERPGVPWIEGARTTSLFVRVPPLPARATSISVLVAPGGSELDPAAPEPGAFAVAHAGLLPGALVEVPVSLVGRDDVVKMWVRLRAGNESGYSDGPAMRDVWAKLRDDKTDLARGYEGWRYIDTLTSREPTPLDEWGTAITELGAQVSTGGFFFGLWWSRPYKCALPPGAVIRVRSDAWGSVPAVIGNKFTFAFSYKTGGPSPQAVYDPIVGTFWYFFVEGSELRVCRQTRPAPFTFEQMKARERDHLVYDGSLGAYFPFRFGATLHVILDTLSDIRIASSVEEGKDWTMSESLGADTDLLGACLSQDGSQIVFLGVAQSTIISNNPDLTEEERNINQGDLVRIAAKFDAGGWTVTRRTKIRPAKKSDGSDFDLPDKEAIRQLLHNAGTRTFVVSEQDGAIRLHASDDDLVTLSELLGA